MKYSYYEDWAEEEQKELFFTKEEAEAKLKEKVN